MNTEQPPSFNPKDVGTKRILRTPGTETVYSSARIEKKPKGRSLLSWPLVFLILILLLFGGCQRSVSKIISFFDKASLTKLSFGPNAPDAVGVLILDGEIYNSIWATESLIKFSENSNIKSVVIRVDSPGGAVAPCQEIYSEVVKLAAKKDVIISMGSVAASGGLYVAMGGTHVMANNGTVTGSIGVIMQSLNFEKTLDKIGVRSTVIKSGIHKDIGSPFREMTATEKALLQTTVDELYKQFVIDISSSRKMNYDDILPIADGRIYSGVEAHKLGLIDELGSYEDAIRLAAKLAGLPTDKRPLLVFEDARGPWWVRIAESRVGNFVGLSNQSPNKVSFKYIYNPEI